MLELEEVSNNFYQNESFFYLFTKLSFIITISYRIFHKILGYYPPYSDIQPSHKRNYVISNLMKGLFLGYYSITSIYLLYNILYLNQWNREHIKFLACLYVVFDYVSLYMVNIRQLNTIWHHLCVGILFILGMAVDFKRTAITEMIVIYAIFSDLAFLVNIYLGLRIISHHNIVRKIKKLSYYNYLTTCILNWSIQAYLIIKEIWYHPLQIGIYMFVFMMSQIVMDDVVLLRFLKK